MFRKKRYWAVLCLMIIMVIAMSGCGAIVGAWGDGYTAQLRYDTIEELQADFPEYYYFSFNKEMILYYLSLETTIKPYLSHMRSRDLLKKNKSLYDYNYYGYFFAYTVCNNNSEKKGFGLQMCSEKRNEATQANLTLYERLPKHENLLKTVLIDNIDCYIIDEGPKNPSNFFECYFEINNVIYCILINQIKHDDVHIISLDEFISFITPMIENRYKGNSSPLLNVMFDSIEEMQTALPDLFYFDFNYEKISYGNMKSREHIDPDKQTADYDFYSYCIRLDDYPTGVDPDIRNVNISVYANKEQTIAGLFPDIKNDYTDYTYSEQTIDGIECILTHSTLDNFNKYTIKLIFELDGVTYYIQLEEILADDGVEQMTDEAFIALIKPVIENRYKV